MKKLIPLLLILCASLLVDAQAPQLIPYQAIARDNAGNPVINQNIGLRFSIHDQTITGTVVWQENQTVVSNTLGIIVTAIGGTTALTSVNWGNGAKFLQVEMDISGGTNYLDMGTQQMMSVPYALYAETSGSVINNNTGGGNGYFTHWIGELFQGGVICHLWKDALGIEHGLIASLNNLGETQFHSSLSLESTLAVSRIDGEYNTSQLQASALPSNSAIYACLNYSYNGYDDWYLPAYQELMFLYKNIFDLNKSLSENIDFDLIGAYNDEISPNDGWSYWSSTITAFNFGTGTAVRVLEPTFGGAWNSSPMVNYCFENNVQLNSVRQVRAFRKF